jgi:type IV pilus assembly protein PilA
MFSKKGFTLIELLIVIIIIGVLATLAVPQYTNYVERARAAEALNMLAAFKTGEAAYKLEEGEYTNTLASLGITNVYGTDAEATAGGQHWYYVVSNATVDTYTITANRSSKNAGSAAGQTIIMTWSDTTGVSWDGDHPGKPKP